MAGFRSASFGELFVATQVGGALLLCLLGSLISVNTGFWMAAGAGVGYLAPDMWLTSRTKRYRDRLRRSIPDAVDLLAICVDAGLGLDQALLRIREELAISHKELGYELDQLNFELRAGTPRIEAWRHLAERTRLQELGVLASILAETERFGTPIVRALSGYSAELRLSRRQHAEEAAAKTKIKILFPLVLCIFPCIFIVLLAPALLNMAASFGSLGQ